MPATFSCTNSLKSTGLLDSDGCGRRPWGLCISHSGAFCILSQTGVKVLKNKSLHFQQQPQTRCCACPANIFSALWRKNPPPSLPIRGMTCVNRDNPQVIQHELHNHSGMDWKNAFFFVINSLSDCSFSPFCYLATTSNSILEDKGFLTFC